VDPIGAGVLLQRSGQAVLERLGTLDRVTGHAAPIEELHARHAGGGTLIRNVFSSYEPGWRAYGVHRGVLFTALRELVERQPVDVRLGCEIVARTETGDGLVQLRDAAGRTHGPFDLVICGDGSRSQLRAALGFSARVLEYPHGTLWVTTPGGGVPGRLLQVVRGTRQLLGLLPLGDGLVSLYWGVRNAEMPSLRARGLAALREEVIAFCPEAEPVFDHIVEFDQVLHTTYRHISMRRWHDDRVIFIGDAAHAMSPHLGQGINIALLDAWRLAAALRHAESPRAGFEAFRRAQHGYVRFYATITRFLAPFFQSDWSVLGLGRDLTLPWLPHLPIVGRQMILTVSGLKGGFLRGRIEV
jgi:2-polyprenyl-6-methoxyphenol hydroxylase-like FAD-dependent oxidoreductase